MVARGKPGLTDQEQAYRWGHVSMLLNTLDYGLAHAIACHHAADRVKVVGR